MALMGADTDELREVGAEFQQGKETVDEVITYLRALIALLRAASFFSGGASAAYAEYLEATVVPWLQKISTALGLFAEVLTQQAAAQDQTSDGARVDLASVPTYRSPALPAPLTPYAGAPIAGGGSEATPGTSTGSTVAAATTGASTTGSSLSGLGTGSGLGGTGSIGATSAPLTWADDTLRPSTSTSTSTSTPATTGLGSSGGIGGGPSAETGAAGTGGAPLGSSSGIGSGAGPGSGGALGSGTPTITQIPPVDGALGGATPGSSEVGSLTSSRETAADTRSPVGAATIGAAAAGTAALGLGGAALAARSGSGSGDPIEALAATRGRGSSGTEVRQLQEQLTAAGYDTRGADGRWGGDTERAFQAYRADHPVQVRPGTGYTSPDGYDYTQITGISNASPEFLRAVEGMSQRLGARPEHVLAAMSFETGGRFSADVRNPQSSATGLIQFMSSTAERMGTSTAELARMTPTEQLTYVERYFEPHRGRLGDLDSVYTSILAGRPSTGDTPLFLEGTQAYGANAPLDTDGDGRITAAEATSHVRSRMGSGGR